MEGRTSKQSLEAGVMQSVGSITVPGGDLVFYRRLQCSSPTVLTFFTCMGSTLPDDACPALHPHESTQKSAAEPKT